METALTNYFTLMFYVKVIGLTIGALGFIGIMAFCIYTWYKE